MDVKMQQLKVTDNGFHQMCRLCLSGDVNKTDIFLFSSEFGKKIADIIMECVPVHITRHDKMPTYICRLCFTQLKKFHQFQMQAVRSDRTLQRYLQPLSDCHPQISTDLAPKEQSNNSASQNYNTDVTSRCESFETSDEFNFFHSKPKLDENKFNEGIFIKSEIKDEPIDDNSLFPTECADTVQTLYKGDGSEDSLIAFDDNKVGVETPKHFECVTEKIFVKSEETYEYIPFKDVDSNLCPENFEDVESAHFNEDNSNRTEYPNRRQKLNEKSHDFRKLLLKKSETSTESKSHQCDICQMCFSKSSNLKRHTLIHTGEKPYQCEICKMLFREARNLKIHNLIHTGEKPYQCEICKMCFRTAHTLKKHNLIHTGEKPYQCDICQMCFRHTISLKNHKLEHTGEKQPSKHQKLNEKSHGFQKIFLAKPAKSYQCDVCQMRFSKSSNLKRHKLIHTGEKPYQCDICKLCFNESGNLKKHILIHTGEKPYQCEICKKCFRQSQTLKKHNLLHTGEKPYKCNICKKCYRRSTSLKKHSLIHIEENL